MSVQDIGKENKVHIAGGNCPCLVSDSGPHILGRNGEEKEALQTLPHSYTAKYGMSQAEPGQRYCGCA